MSLSGVPLYPQHNLVSYARDEITCKFHSMAANCNTNHHHIMIVFKFLVVLTFLYTKFIIIYCGYSKIQKDLQFKVEKVVIIVTTVPTSTDIHRSLHAKRLMPKETTTISSSFTNK